MINKILVVSDTHGRRDTLQRCIDLCSPFDIIIHCGDGIKDIRGAVIPDGATVLAVAGNIDLYLPTDEETILFEKISGKNVMVTHGHIYQVKNGLQTITLAAGKFNADVVFFGHTHQPYSGGSSPLLFNPGDLSTGNYGVVNIREDSKWVFEHRTIEVR